jgi:penicillin amidase
MVRKFAAVLVSLLLLLLAAAGVFYLYLRSSLPQLDGETALPGLLAKAEIRRDANGVAYIAARSAGDAWFALGFAHAQDRLFQMDFQRRLGAGRLSEAMGSRTLVLDRFMRTLGLYRVAEENLKHLSEETREALESYAAGVNAYLSNRPGALPPEFTLLGYKPERWKPADTVVWGRLMALTLGDNMRHEILRARLAKRVTPQQLNDLYPGGQRRDAPTTLAAAGLLETLWAALPLDMLGAGASNEWALSGQHSATGKPILANDPHLRFGMPNLWYLARIEAPGLTLAGATVPGVPFVLLGHNGKAAWAMTATHGDTQDLFVERVDPADPKRYQTPQGPLAFETRAETIKVRGEADVTLTVRATRHGPVLSDVQQASREALPRGMPGEGLGAEEGEAMALSFAGLAADDRTVEAIHRINRAGDAVQLLAALKDFHSPLMNVAVADVAGNIGYVVAGRVPVRRGGDGRLPAPGWNGEFDWTGWLQFDALPRAFNPQAGVIVNANNKPAGDSSLLGSDWEAGYRARRILDMLAIDQRPTVEATAAMQNDALSMAARDLLPVLTGVVANDERARRAVAMLKNWDGRMDRRRAEPLIFSAWLRELNHLLYADELGPLFADYWDLRPDVVEAMLTQRRQWCDDVTTPQRETCEARVAQALDRALDFIAERHGANPADWRWGDAHMAKFSHPLFGRLPLVWRLSDLRLPSDGDAYTVNRGQTIVADAAEPFAHIHGAGYRAVYDLADLDNSRYMLAAGQSGNPLSAFYSNLARRWRDGRTIRIPASPPAGPREKTAVLTLMPQRR